MAHVLLSLGSNLGNKKLNLEKAIEKLTELGTIVRRSKFYRSTPYGKKDQPDFVNLCLLLETQLFPVELLKACQRIERELGRVRYERWGARTIDIDILFYDEAVIDEKTKTPALFLPHPEIQKRRFVLVPLQEIVPLWKHPVSKKSVTELLKDCKDDGRVEALP